MPLFEYRCRSCASQFEALVTQSRAPECPDCNSQDLARLLSVFAVGSQGPATAPRERGPVGACGACGDPRGPGSCAVG